MIVGANLFKKSSKPKDIFLELNKLAQNSGESLKEYTTCAIKLANKLVDTEFEVTNEARNELWRKGLGSEFYLLNHQIKHSSVCPPEWDNNLPISVILVEAQDYLDDPDLNPWMQGLKQQQNDTKRERQQTLVNTSQRPVTPNQRQPTSNAHTSSNGQYQNDPTLIAHQRKVMRTIGEFKFILDPAMVQITVDYFLMDVIFVRPRDTYIQSVVVSRA